MKYFQKILGFEKLLKQFNEIYRDLGSLHLSKEFDNDVEHSYRVAMLCWMIADEYKLKLDINKIVKYALVHDFTEVYAGDFSLHKNYDQKVKEKKEHQALLKLKKKFPKLKTIWKSIEEYEKRKDEESKFVYIIEKMEPALLTIISEKDHYKKRGVSFENFFNKKQKKIKDIDSFAQNFNIEVMDYLRKHKKEFFD